MTRRSLGISVSVLLVLCLSGIAALAQKNRVKVEVAFNFSAAGVTFSPGRYEIATDPQGAARLSIRSLPNGEATYLSYVTRLAERKGENPQLVFDKDGDNTYLTEIHIPGTDGFYLKGAPGEHRHMSVQGTGQ
jgi:hypothetical protein